jgi:hypothetical protein
LFLQALAEFLAAISHNPMARGLSVEAYLLVPVQRLTRYPLLVGAILDATSLHDPDHEWVDELRARLIETVKACNERVRTLEDRQTVADIAAVLDWSRLTQGLEVDDDTRVLVKRGTMELCTFVGAKITKSKPVEVFLFSDLFLYAKPVKVKKTMAFAVCVVIG